MNAPCLLSGRTGNRTQVNSGSTINELENLLGGMTLSDDESEVLEAEAMRMVILLENTQTVVNGDYSDPIPEAWEEVFIDVALVGVLSRSLCSA